jgi:hypothetical protein
MGDRHKCSHNIPRSELIGLASIVTQTTSNKISIIRKANTTWEGEPIFLVPIDAREESWLFEFSEFYSGLFEKPRRSIISEDTSLIEYRAQW